MIRIAFILFLTFFYLPVCAQDPTLSQVFNNLQLLNPAATGLIPGAESVRLTGYTRSQWSPLAEKAYHVNGIMADGRKCMKKGSFALGGMVQEDGAKLGRWRHIQAHLTGAYHQPIHQKQFLAAGFYAGVLQNSLNTNGLRFDQQFGASGYDPQASIGESFAQSTPFRLDIHAGVLLYEIERQWSVGLVIHHVNQPEYSFFDNTNNDLLNRLDVGFTLHTSFTLARVEQIRRNQFWRYQVMLKKQSISLTGNQLNTRQSQQWQCLLGAESRQITGLSIGNYIRLSGRSMRYIIPDAYVIQGNWRTGNIRVGLSYDVNLSRILAANRHGGSLELTLSARFGTYKKCVICPH